MTERGHWPLQIRFLSGLLVVLVGLSLFYGYLFRKMGRQILEAEAEESAVLILDHAVAIQTYIRETLRPTMYDTLPGDQFILEAMSSSYVTRRIMTDLNHSSTKYLYRRVGVGARNPDFEARGVELEILERIKAQGELKPHLEYRSVNGEQNLLAARPVVFDEGCMHCHGEPDDAPKEVLDKYGSERGFHRHPGDVAGLDLVAIPVHTELALINKATTALIAIFALGTMGFFAIIQAFFQRLVVHNLKRAAEMLTRQLGGQADTEILARLHKSDQIEKIIVGIDELARHLRVARSELEDHAAALESKVAKRTQALGREAAQRQADVALFVDMLHLLHLLNGPRLVDEELRLVLKRLVDHFEADVAVMVCAVGQGRVRTWPPEAGGASLPECWREVAMEGRPCFEAGLAMVPVASMDAERGALGLIWKDGRLLDEQSQRLLSALGIQLGIALDSQEAMASQLHQKNLLQSVFEGIADPLALLDRSGGVLLSNESGRSGVDMARLIQASPGQAALLEKVLGDGEPATCEIEFCDRTFTMSLYPLPGPSRGNDRVVAYARDVTAEKRFLGSIRQHEKMATVGRLAAGLAHEINNPLGVIQCYADLLLVSAQGEREREDLEVIIRHSRQASKILSDILAFARPKKDGGRCAPREVVSRIVRVFSVQASVRRVEVVLGDLGALPYIGMSDSCLEQVLGNLLLNALDAVDAVDAVDGEGGQNLTAPEPGGRIDVSASHDKVRREVVFTVADNGPGVAEADKERIFDPFYTTKEVGRGTGLGLAVVYGLVSEAGGSISVENRRGAVFRVRLPVAVEGERVQGASDAN